MPTTFPDDEPGRIEQHNHGPGVLVGRDNYGPIHNAIDETTKKVLRKLAQEAPDLAKLLEKALRDGIVSPDAAFALEYAARNINHDVADALMFAGRSINADTAESLHYSAETIMKSLEHIRSVYNDIERIDRSNRPGGSMRSFDEHAEDIKSHIDHMAISPQVQRVVDWRPTFKAFFVGLAIGMLIIGIFWIKS